MSTLATNRKAHFEYEMLDKFEAGIKLVGSEVKSVRQKNLSIAEAYCVFTTDRELYIRGMHIAHLKEGGQMQNHEVLRERKLLLNKKELNKLLKGLIVKGYTIIPLKVYLKGGFIKVEISLARGKKQYDKRMDTKLKDIKRDMDREIN